MWRNFCSNEEELLQLCEGIFTVMWLNFCGNVKGLLSNMEELLQ
eukprot:UN17275